MEKKIFDLVKPTGGIGVWTGMIEGQRA